MDNGTRSRLKDNDRLGVTVFASLLLHMLVVLGVTFAAPKLREVEGMPTLEITLVQAASSRAPDEPDFLAQANQDGGGEAEDVRIARNPLPARALSPAAPDVPAARPAPQAAVPAARSEPELLTQRRAPTRAPASQPEPEPQEARIDPARLGLPDPTDLDRTQLIAAIDREWERYHQRPKRKFLNARTREYKYAAYMDAWRAKVERIGNLNYPEEAKRRGLRGSVLLDVEVHEDGSVGRITIHRSSGYKLIDDAAVRIVHLAAPFAPFPPDIRKETDILHITRTWIFNDALSSER
jgi:protein TonB